MKPWLAAPLALATITLAAGLTLALRTRAAEIAIALAVLALVLPILWIAVSALRPAMPDRHCPRCREEALVLLEPGNKHGGVRCRACGLEDRELYVPFLIDVMDDPAVTDGPIVRAEDRPKGGGAE